MRNRTLFIVALASYLVVVTAAVTLATVSPYKARPLDRQNLGWIQGAPPVTTTKFTWLGGWGPSDSMTIHTKGDIAATLSVTVTGAPMEFRLTLEDVQHGWALRMMKPDAAVFDPGTGTTSGSFTWVAAVGAGTYTVDVQLRSPSGAPATLEYGSLVVQYGAE
jgi:hypothetical protein